MQCFEERIVPSEDLLGKRSWEDWLYQVEWQAETTKLLAPTVPYRSWVIVADGGQIADQLAGQLTEQGCRVQVVQAQSAADYRQVLESQQEDFGVIALQHLDVATEGESLAWQAPTEGMLYLVQALAAAKRAPAGVWIITRNAQSVTVKDSNAGLAQAALWGMAKTVTLEHPALHCVMVDVDAANDTAITHTLLTELSRTRQADSHETQIAYRQGQRYVARLNTHSLAKTDAESVPSIPVHSDASYLITGGTGGLGLEVAGWLVAQGAQHLTLLARRVPSPAVQQQIATLQQAGATINVVQADIADFAQVAAIITTLNAQAPLKGIIHAAGVLDDGILQRQSLERFAKVMRLSLIHI
jgi:hypothetical protein